MRPSRTDHSLDPARGILLGVLLSIPIWALVLGGFWLGASKLVQIHLPDQEAFHAAPRTASLESGR